MKHLIKPELILDEQLEKVVGGLVTNLKILGGNRGFGPLASVPALLFGSANPLASILVRLLDLHRRAQNTGL